MSIALRNRLREASVVLPDDQLGEYEAAIAKLASPAAVPLDEQLARIRLAFGLESTRADDDRFDEQLAQAGIAIDRRSVQLREVLACCVLVARFARGQGRRKRTSLAGDTVAALSAQALTRSGLHAKHPDVALWARYWRENIAQDLRAHSAKPAPPTLNLDQPAVDAVEPSAGVLASLERWREQLDEYGHELAEWSQEIDVVAQDEQLSLMWWLMSGHTTDSATEAVLASTQELVNLTQRIPGPPRADQLLSRRLGDHRDAMVSVAEIGELAGIEVPPRVRSYCPLLTRDDRVSELEIEGLVAAQWLFDEMQLIRLEKEGGSR